LSSLAILIDFGSAFTKVTAVDLAQAQVIGRSQSPSTVATDVCEGLLRVLTLLQEQHTLSNEPPKNLTIPACKTVFESSSAAGEARTAVVSTCPA